MLSQSSAVKYVSDSDYCLYIEICNFPMGMTKPTPFPANQKFFVFDEIDIHLVTLYS